MFLTRLRWVAALAHLLKVSLSPINVGLVIFHLFLVCVFFLSY